MSGDDVVMVVPNEDDVYCSSAYYKKAIKFKPSEIREKMMLARQITQACNQLANDNKITKAHTTYSGLLVDKLHVYTNLPVPEIETILLNMGTRDRSFFNAFKNVTELNDNTLDLLSNDIRSIFVHYYVVLKKLPSKLNLLQSLKDKGEMYLEEDLSIQKLVKNKLVKYCHIPAYNRYLLMEHPERVYQRTLYLKAMQEYRLHGRNIIYIDMRKMTKSRSPTFYVGLALMPQQKLFEKFLASDISESGPTKWLKRRVLPNIPPDSVVVLYEDEKKDKKLTAGSKRSAILAWLDANNISYGKNPHTAEVYALYKAHENKVETKGTFDYLFTQAGIDVINCSKKWTSLNCFKRFWEQINNKYEIFGRKLDLELFKEVIIKATIWITQNIEFAERKIIKAEKKMITEDAEMETILENLMEMVNQGDIRISEFPDDICGDKTENFETHICDIISIVDN